MFARSRVKVKQSVDIWSVGCIYSEAAVWIADGYRGVMDYRRRRKAETDQLRDFRDGDCFHDGYKVLNAVRETHRNIERSLRVTDNITKQVLDTIIKEMLWESDVRPTANQLRQKPTQLLKWPKPFL
jgi:hypothetical protein